jgi:hypothetical protein
MQVESAGGTLQMTTKTGNPESVSLRPDKLASAFLADSGGSARKMPFKWKSKQIVERRKA